MIRAGWPNSLTLIMAKSNKDKTSVNQASLGLELELSSEVITPDVLHSPRLLLCRSSLCLTATRRPLFCSRQRVIYMDGITKSSAVWGSSLLWICYFSLQPHLRGAEPPRAAWKSTTPFDKLAGIFWESLSSCRSTSERSNMNRFQPVRTWQGRSASFQGKRRGATARV